MENSLTACITTEAVCPGDHFWPPLSLSPLNKKAYIDLAHNSLGCSSKKQGLPHVHTSDKERTCWIIIESSEFSAGGSHSDDEWVGHICTRCYSHVLGPISAGTQWYSLISERLKPSLRHCNTVNIQIELGSPTYISSAMSQLCSVGWPPNHSDVCLFVLMYRNVIRTAQECYFPWSIWK